MNIWVVLSVLGAMGTAAWTLTFSTVPKNAETQAILESLKSEPIAPPSRGVSSVNPQTLASSFSKVMDFDHHKSLEEKLKAIDSKIKLNPVFAKLQNSFGDGETEKLAFALVYLNSLQPAAQKTENDQQLSKELFEELEKDPEHSIRQMERTLDLLVGQFDDLRTDDELKYHSSAFMRLDYYSTILSNTLKQENPERYQRLMRLAEKSTLSRDDSPELLESKTKRILMIHSYLTSTTGNAQTIIEETLNLVQKNPQLKATISSQLGLMFPEAVEDYKTELKRQGI